MPIIFQNDALTNHEKKEVKVFLANFVKKKQGSFSEKDYLMLIESVSIISESKYDMVRELAIYIKAISIKLKLKTDRQFFEKGEHILLGSLRYFVEVHDVIEDYIPIRGYLDDAYCVNYAISKQTKKNKDLIEHIAKHLKKMQGNI